jgi:hypothetical protein
MSQAIKEIRRSCDRTVREGFQHEGESPVAHPGEVLRVYTGSPDSISHSLTNLHREGHTTYEFFIVIEREGRQLTAPTRERQTDLHHGAPEKSLDRKRHRLIRGR